MHALHVSISDRVLQLSCCPACLPCASGRAAAAVQGKAYSNCYKEQQGCKLLLQLVSNKDAVAAALLQRWCQTALL
jgi:hypothetical protein